MEPKNESRIDCIIPYYNGREFLADALASIAAQTLANRTDVTIVDDCSPDGGCGDIAEQFAGILRVRVLRLEKNGGQGMARQYGIDHTQNPFITFMDQDDTLVGPMALETLLLPLREDGECGMTDGCSLHAQGMPDGGVTLSEPTSMEAWVHGKMYRRSMLERYGIRFGAEARQRQNEDTGFNTQLYLLAGPEETRSTPQAVYCWHDNPQSVSRRDEHAFDYDEGVVGYVANILFAYSQAEHYPTGRKRIPISITGALWRLYVQYLGALREASGYAPGLLALRDEFCGACRAYAPQVTAQMLRERAQHADPGWDAGFDGHLPVSFEAFAAPLYTKESV